MNWNDAREAIKWSLLVSMLVACWCGVLAVRKARAIDQPPQLHDIAPSPKSGAPQSDPELKPVWVIVVFELQTGKLVGITEFVFPTYDACLAGARQARERFDLTIRPVCYLRWLESIPRESA